MDLKYGKKHREIGIFAAGAQRVIPVGTMASCCSHTPPQFKSFISLDLDDLCVEILIHNFYDQ